MIRLREEVRHLLSLTRILSNKERTMRLVIQAFFLSLIFLVGLAGCNTMEGAGEDIEAGGEAMLFVLGPYWIFPFLLMSGIAQGASLPWLTLAIAIHNFPEGLATFIATLEDPALGISIAIAIAIHNVPEGIAVSVPIYHATGSRRKALRLSFLSGLAEPVGAVIGYLLLSPFMNDMVFGLLFAGVAGIMVFISLDELLPTAEHYGEHHITIYGLIAGMVVMAVSIVMMA